VVVKLVHVAGQTPPDPDELHGLKPKHITTQDELNQFEHLNIVAGQRWAMKQYAKRDLLHEGFVRDLHKKMFDKTWKWAGNFRSSDKNIGTPWEHIGTRLDQLLKNAEFQVQAKTFAPDELAVRFHRDLVWIHPFPNGNGRHARLMADLLVMSLGGERFTWGSADLVVKTDARDAYLHALRAADKGDFGPLIAFSRA
jgi:Fic-DOC domain mobile mystery protein B